MLAFLPVVKGLRKYVLQMKSKRRLKLKRVKVEVN